MVRTWVVFTSRKRRQYNKTILVWISMFSHWKTHFSEMYNLPKTWITLSNEYTVENTHSTILAEIRHSDTTTQLVNKVKGNFMSKTKQVNFRSNFTTQKYFSFSRGQLKYLKLKSFEFLITALESIIKHQSRTTLHNSKSYHGSPVWRQDHEWKHSPDGYLSNTPSNEMKTSLFLCCSSSKLHRNYTEIYAELYISSKIEIIHL